jgi:hypothetical protein
LSEISSSGQPQNAKESYGFKPTPEVRSFAQFIGHIADDQYAYCSAVKGESKSSDFEKTPPHSRRLAVDAS